MKQIKILTAIVVGIMSITALGDNNKTTYRDAQGRMQGTKK